MPVPAAGLGVGGGGELELGVERAGSAGGRAGLDDGEHLVSLGKGTAGAVHGALGEERFAGSGLGDVDAPAFRGDFFRGPGAFVGVGGEFCGIADFNPAGREVDGG